MTEYISIGSTRNRKFHGIVRANSLGNELLGKLGFIQFKPNKNANQVVTVLCQITSVDRHNSIHEDPSFGPVIASQGRIPHLSDIGDYENTVAKPIAQQIEGKPAPLRANPPSGTAIVSLDDTTVAENGSSQKVFNSFASAESMFLRYGGTLVGEPIHVPFVCKSFNPSNKEGWGEARHAGFFGRSGSGKTHAAKAMLGLALTSVSDLGAFIPDGKGDFLSAGDQDLNILSFLAQNDRQVKTVKIDELKLEDVEHFYRFLEIEGIHKFLMTGNKQLDIIDMALNKFTDDKDKLIVGGAGCINLESFLAEFNNMIQFVYAGSAKEIDKKMAAAREQQQTCMPRIKDRFNKVLKRFNEGIEINNMVDSVLQNGAIYFLDIQSYDSEINRFILGVIYRRFRKRSSYFFKQKKYSNAIVYVDEANRFIPQAPSDDIKSLAAEMIDGIKTTRQYGLAWWFADQRPAAISKDAFTQLGTYFFGRGMTAAADVANMESVLGSEGVQIYDYVMSSSRTPFLASGQFVGIGHDEGISIPVEFFSSWKELVEKNNSDFDANLQE
jgi:Helicase HerA, central domain